MGLTILIIVSVMCAASLGVMLHLIFSVYKKYKHQVSNSKLDRKKQEEYKEELLKSLSAATCAKVSWQAVYNDATVVSINKRKSNYSDERESEHFCENLTDDRIALMDKIDMECHYGRY